MRSARNSANRRYRQFRANEPCAPWLGSRAASFFRWRSRASRRPKRSKQEAKVPIPPQQVIPNRFFSRCNTADETNVRLLQHDKELDEGEAEALIQAQETATTFFIGDEKRARSIAENLGLTCVGTIRLIARLHLEGRAGEPRALVQELRRNRRFRVSEEVIEHAIATAGEPI